jgi:hypothetical protein
MICPLCEKRKAKRYCPGIGNHICAQCCGTYREVTIDCPSTCPYLRESRRQHLERPPVATKPAYLEIDISQAFLAEREGLIMALSYAIVQYAAANRALVDPDVSDTLDHFIRTLATLRSGVIYQSLPTGPLREGLFRALESAVAEFRKSEERHMVVTRVRDADVHRAAVLLARMGQIHSNGRPRSRAFLDALRSQFPELEKHQEQRSALIIP